ncbi:hypothetical protein Mapa_002752 [Marchantia paleacea]|nr:hypothetical protein Mapa_002752 [Marchantia paleacea]
MTPPGFRSSRTRDRPRALRAGQSFTNPNVGAASTGFPVRFAATAKPENEKSSAVTVWGSLPEYPFTVIPASKSATQKSCNGSGSEARMTASIIKLMARISELRAILNTRGLSGNFFCDQLPLSFLLLCPLGSFSISFNFVPKYLDN